MNLLSIKSLRPNKHTKSDHCLTPVKRMGGWWHDNSMLAQEVIHNKTAIYDYLALVNVVLRNLW